jgi:hypothetical protein
MEKQYINEIGRSFQIMLKEHCIDIRHNHIKNSSLAEHSQDSGHHICIGDTKVIAKMEHYGKRKVREVIGIEINRNNLNRDEGLKISKYWKPILHNIKINNNTPTN